MAKNLTNSELNLRLIEVEKDVETLKSDIEELRPVLVAQAEQKIQYSHIVEMLSELRDDVKILKDKPSKFVDYAVMAIIASLIGILFKVFGI